MNRTLFFLILHSAHFVFAQSDDARKKNFNINKNIAIEGYDPVSYFDNKPAKGDSRWTYQFNGVTYRFSSSVNQAKFRISPGNYEPAYGGWCAYAMGKSGEKVKIDPETFKIVDGQLYLFYNFWGNNTLKDWEKDEKVLKQKADVNWMKILALKRGH